MKKIKKTNLRFIKEKDYLKPTEIDNYKDYFVVVDKDKNIIDTSILYLGDNLYEISARDDKGDEIKRVIEVKLKNDKNGIDLPRPIKKYR